MRIRISLAGIALAFLVFHATPSAAQEVETDKAKAAEPTMMKKAGAEAKSEGAQGCQCTCMREGHAGMMGAKAEEAAGAAGETGAGSEAQVAMADARAAMSDGEPSAGAEARAEAEGCRCMSHGQAGAEGEGMMCRMHGGQGQMKGEGMQHRHGAEKADEGQAKEDSGG